MWKQTIQDYIKTYILIFNATLKKKSISVTGEIKQRIVEGSASKPALVQDTNYMVQKT